MLQNFAQIFQPLTCGEPELAFEAIASVEPGGHFFGCSTPWQRYKTAFYEPFVSDWSNFGTWTENGSKTATQRANAIWKKILREFEPPPMDETAAQALEDFVQRRASEGGALPG